MPESTRHRDAFNRYYDLGGQRSLHLLQETLRTEKGTAPSLRTLEDWSARYRWQDRIAELERSARRVEDEARVQAIREMQQRHAQEGLLLQQRGAEWLTALNADGVSAEAAIRAIVEGVKLERLARGDVTERTEIQQTGDERLMRLSDDELDQLLSLASSLDGEAAPLP